MKKKIIWIDYNVNNNENQATLELLKKELSDYEFSTFTSVSSAFKKITDKKDKNNNFFFNLFYVIVSGSLAEEFFNKYIEASIEFPIIAATIVLCFNKSFHEQKPYYLDQFLNPGKIVSSYDKIIDYIKADECNWKNNMGITKKKYNSLNKEFGMTFEYADSFSKIAYPIYLQKIINSSIISEYDIINFQVFFFTYFSEYNHLIKPSQEKNIDIPYHILAKFYLNIYTQEKCQFYRIMNKDLSNKRFDDYKTYIFLMYNALNKKTIKNYNYRLYRGGKISKKELNQIEEIINNIKNNKNNKNNSSNNEINAALYFPRNFLSFSKDEKVANFFIESNYDNKNNELVSVKYILHSNKSKDFLSTNLDIEELSAFNDEKEVLILPLSCFEIKEIKNTFIYKDKEKIDIKEFHLYYLSEYKKQIDKYLSEITQDKLDIFFKEILESKLSKEIFDNFGIEVNIGLKNFFEQITPYTINYNFNNILINHPKGKNKYKEHRPKHLSPQSKLRFKNKTFKQFESNIENEKVNIITTNINQNEIKEIDKLNLPKINYHNKENIYNMKGNGNNNQIINRKFHPQRRRYHSHKRYIKRNIYNDFNMYGTTIGYFLSNYGQFKESSHIEKLKTITNLTAPIILSHISKNIPTLRTSLITFSLVKSTYDNLSNLNSSALYKSEIFKLISQNIAVSALDMGISAGFMQLGTTVCYSLGIVSAPGLALFGLFGGIGGYIGGKLLDKFYSSLKLKSDSLYYKYIPKKFREKTNPNLKWENVSKNAKSFIIEMLDHNYNCRWLVLNIPPDKREIMPDNKIGDTVIEYKGIEFNSFKTFFNLYEINNNIKITLNDWKSKEVLKNYISQFASLEIN